MSTICRRVLALALVLLVSSLVLLAHAKEAEPTSSNPELEARVLAIGAELRCLVCQNETIAASHADLAVDLRNQVREMLRQGNSDADVMRYMTDRYGDFILYRPPVKSTTLVLWYGPVALLVAGLVGLWWMLRRRNRLAADQFDADEPTDEPAGSGRVDDPQGTR